MKHASSAKRALTRVFGTESVKVKMCEGKILFAIAMALQAETEKTKNQNFARYPPTDESNKNERNDVINTDK